MKKLPKEKITKAKVASKADAKFHKNENLNKVLILLKKAAKSEKASFTKKQRTSFSTKIAAQANF